jgi:hypothetical protein
MYLSYCVSSVNRGKQRLIDVHRGFMSGALPPLSHTPSWCAQGRKMCLTTVVKPHGAWRWMNWAAARHIPVYPSRDVPSVMTSLSRRQQSLKMAFDLFINPRPQCWARFGIAIWHFSTKTPVRFVVVCSSYRSSRRQLVHTLYWGP